MDYKILIVVLIVYLGLITDARHRRRHRGRYQRVHRHRHVTRGQGRLPRVRTRNNVLLLPYEAQENVEVKERMNVSLWKLEEESSARQNPLRQRRGVSRDEQSARMNHLNIVRDPWPRPRAFYTDPERVYSIDPNNFRFVVSPSSKTCQTLAEALYRHFKAMRGRAPILGNYVASKTIKSVEVTVMTSCVDDSPGVDRNETYTLEIDDSGGFIRADDVVGVLRGLETLVQLMYRDTAAQIYINYTRITDFPRVKRRVLFIDTARQKIKPQNLKKILDFMEMNKLNILHWKLPSHQFSPLTRDIAPGRSEKESYSRTMYNETVITDIVDYARQRGIAVMPELNTIGGVVSWRDKACAEEDIALAMDYLSKPAALHKVWKKILVLFPAPFILVREDDVFSSCWTSSPSIQRFMTKHGMLGYQELSVFIRQRVLEELNQTRTLVFGEEVLSSTYPADKTSIIHIEKTSPQTATQKGYRVLYSPHWCLNTTVKLFDCLHKHIVKMPYLKLLWGVEAGAVENYTDDVTLLDTIWPPASVMAQVTWSGLSTENKDEIKSRFQEHACRMSRRGLTSTLPQFSRTCKIPP